MQAFGAPPSSMQPLPYSFDAGSPSGFAQSQGAAQPGKFNVQKAVQKFKVSEILRCAGVLHGIRGKHRRQVL